MKNVNFTECEASFGGALYLENAPNVKVDSCLFENNSVSDSIQTNLVTKGGGIFYSCKSTVSF